jgi:hypothetical protein
VGAALGSNWHLPKWTIETLANEILATPKASRGRNRTRQVDCGKFWSLGTASNLLRAAEEADDAITLANTNILDELPRIGHRQFPWQRGFDNKIHLHRAHAIFGGPNASNHFFGRTGISPVDFALVGFALWATVKAGPYALPQAEIPALGLTQAMTDATLKVLVADHDFARGEAMRLRLPQHHMAYRESVFRRFPLISFGRGQRLRTPVPDLVIERVTGGLYYDMANAGGEVRTEIGTRFEDYVAEYLSEVMPALGVRRTLKYGNKRQPRESPDILLQDDGMVSVIVECKAKRMPFAARLGDGTLKSDEAQTGLDELAKGVFQVWRFVCHARQGQLSDIALANDAVGVVVTLDPWLSMTNRIYDVVLERAKELAAKREPSMEERDRCPVAVCAIESLERALRVASKVSLTAAIRKAASTEGAAWDFDKLHEEFVEPGTKERDFHLEQRLDRLLPWWGHISAISNTRERNPPSTP